MKCAVGQSNTSQAECHDLPDRRWTDTRQGARDPSCNQRRAQRCGGKQRSTAGKNRNSPEIAWASIPTDAAGRTRARFLDCPPAGDGRHRHDPERQFFGPGFHPGDYVFTFATDALRIRTRSDSGSTASPRRPWSRAFPSMGHYATHTQRRPECWRESENHQRAAHRTHRSTCARGHQPIVYSSLMTKIIGK